MRMQKILPFLFCLILPWWVCADETTAPSDALEKFFAAWNQHDVEAIGSTLGENFSVTGIDQVTITNRTSLAEYFVGHFEPPQGPFEKMEMTLAAPAKVVSETADLVLLSGTLQEKQVLYTGKAFEFESAFSAMLIKEEGAWKVHTFHGGVDAFQNPMVRDANMMWTQVVVFTAVGGFVLGGIFALALFRRSGMRHHG
jgi:hypothetical protein